MNLRFIIRDGQKILQQQVNPMDAVGLGAVFCWDTAWEDVPLHDQKGDGCPECKAPLYKINPTDTRRECTRCCYMRNI